MTEPLSLEQVKANLRVDTNDDDALISALIEAARGHVEDVTSLVLTPRQITETAPRLAGFIELRSWPVASVDAIRYPVAGVMTTLDPSTWAVRTASRPVRIVPVAWSWGIIQPTPLYWRRPTLSVEIDITAGYATPADVPAPVLQAMHLLIAHWYTNRSAVEAGVRAAAVELPIGVSSLLRRWRGAVI